ncbi:MAG TPA: VWA domain-containing protein [Pyrinomonadaceae bacterium]|nr:VWA domain-containing protein [Pyrinomonadaceae bacterium]
MQIFSSFKARKRTLTFLAFFVFAAAAGLTAAHGQNPNPTATPEKDEIINIRTDLIQTNVTVFDKNNRFVEGLKPEQFQLTVDGKPAKIEFFEAFAPVKTVERTESKSTGGSGGAAVTNLSLRGRKIVFFVDDLHLSFDSLGRTRSTISHFIENDMQPTDQAVIISSSGQIGFLQQFTDNKAVLRAALARLKALSDTFKDTDSPPMPPYTAVRIVNGDRSAAELYIQKIVEGMKTGGTGGSTSVNRSAVYETVKQRANNIVRAMTAVSESSVSSLENLLLTLNQTPGRKIVYFISDGFYMQTERGQFIQNNRMQRAVNLATRSGSVIYTIDARGLFSSGAADATGERPVDSLGESRSRLAEDTAAQEGLFVLANETGGRFLKNQNYFEKWIDRMLDENASYYVLAWSPEKEEPGAGKFKRIEASVVGRPDLTVRLQRGYLTNWEKTAEKNAASTTGSSGGSRNPTETASLNIIGDSAPKKFLPTSLSLNYLDVPNVGGVLTSSVQIATDSLSYGAGGSQSAAVDLVGLIYNEQGKQVGDFKTGLNITPSLTAASNAQSVIYNHRTPLAAGLYLVKVAAREAKSGQVGIATQWIEIPDLAKKQLTLGSILLGAKTVRTGGADATQQQQVQFSVDHRFSPRPFNLDFLTFVYNAAQSSNGEINLTTQISVFDARGRAVISTPVRPLPVKGASDLARIPLKGSIRQDSIPPGVYLLQVTVSDTVAGTNFVQQTLFTIG